MYLDPAGAPQGPFTRDEITEWHQGGFFPMDLPLRPKGKVYEGFYPQWDEENPVHLIGYSFGGLTNRMLLHLLNSTFNDGDKGELDDSELLGKSLKNWIKSITTMSTPHNGSTLSDIVIRSLPFTDNLLPLLNFLR